jgi:hypothetical protein
VRHEEAWKRLPDLLEDRDDAGLLAHVRLCADCQRQLFLLGRVDRLLRENAPAHGRARKRRRTQWRVLAAAATVATVADTGAMLALFVPEQARSHKFMLRTPSGQLAGEAKVGNSDARNDSLALTARGLPVNRGHVFVLWAGDEKSSMQVGRFMVDHSGGCRVSFNLPATHSWRRFWVTEPGNAALVAST